MIQRMERRFVIRGAWNREIEQVFNRYPSSVVMLLRGAEERCAVDIPEDG
jgi:hypothetical protein